MISRAGEALLRELVRRHARLWPLPEDPLSEASWIEPEPADALEAEVWERVRGGEPRTGYDFGDPTFPKCPHSWCREQWHGLAITRRMLEMRGWGEVDPAYRYVDDDSEVLCPGSLFEGEFTPPADYAAPAHDGVASMFFPTGRRAIIDGEIDWTTDDIKVMLCTRAYTPSSDHQYRADIGHEIYGIGYEPGGKSLTARTVSVDSNYLVLDADHIAWHNATFRAFRAIVYKNSGHPETSPVICYIVFDIGPSVRCGTFALTWGAAGLGRIPRETSLVEGAPSRGGSRSASAGRSL